MAIPVLICSLDDLAQLYSINLDKFEPRQIIAMGQASSDKFSLKDLYLKAVTDTTDLARKEKCDYVGCFRFTFIPNLNGYYAEGLGLKPKG